MNRHPSIHPHLAAVLLGVSLLGPAWMFFGLHLVRKIDYPAYGIARFSVDLWSRDDAHWLPIAFAGTLLNPKVIGNLVTTAWAVITFLCVYEAMKPTLQRSRNCGIAVRRCVVGAMLFCGVMAASSVLNADSPLHNIMREISSSTARATGPADWRDSAWTYGPEGLLLCSFAGLFLCALLLAWFGYRAQASTKRSCQHCGYSLTGLRNFVSDYRCPECGKVFDPDEPLL